MSRANMNPNDIIPLFDAFLFDHNQAFNAIIIGGGALNIMKVIDRGTVDIDVLSPDIPTTVKELSEKFREKCVSKGIHLIENWINNGPASLVNDLPPDWEANTQIIFQGQALTLYSLGRIDLLKSKLFAFCDREERDLEDLIALSPSQEEITTCTAWLCERDGNPLWSNHVKEKLKSLSKELGHEL